MSTLNLRLFGPPQLTSADGSPTARSGRARTVALLALAAASGPTGVFRARVASLLWPDSDPAKARNSLRQELFNIRQDLGAQVVRQDGEVIRLVQSRVIIDVWRFENACAA